VAGPTWAALLPSLVPRAELPAAVGAVQGLAMLLGMAGPVVAGASVGLGGVTTALVAAGSCFAAVAVLASCVRTRRDVGALHGGRRPRAGDGLAYLRTEPVLSVLVTGFVAFVLAVELVGVVSVFLVRDRLGADELTYGVLGAVLATGLVGGNLLAGRVRSDRLLRAVVLGAAGMSLALVAGGLAPGVLPLGVAFLALGLANGIVNTAAQATMAVRVPHEQRGRVLAATSGVLRTASVVGVVGGGLVGTVLGPRELFRRRRRRRAARQRVAGVAAAAGRGRPAGADPLVHPDEHGAVVPGDGLGDQPRVEPVGRPPGAGDAPAPGRPLSGGLRGPWCRCDAASPREADP
jgi:predicted MFS family arabinose efflux permease